MKGEEIRQSIPLLIGADETMLQVCFDQPNPHLTLVQEPCRSGKAERKKMPGFPGKSRREPQKARKSPALRNPAAFDFWQIAGASETECKAKPPLVAKWL